MLSNSRRFLAQAFIIEAAHVSNTWKFVSKHCLLASKMRALAVFNAFRVVSW